MSAVDDCAECRRLTDAYETATIAWFRLEGNLQIAEYGRDEQSSQNLALELGVITDKRRDLREAIELHNGQHAG